MKKALMILMMAAFVAMTACADRAIAPTDLPKAVQTFVTQTFPDKAITYAETEWNEYEVVLNDGTEIKFNGTNWESIESYAGIPLSVLPSAAAEQISKSYAAQKIVEVEKERNTYEVKLSNRIVLYFNAKGTLIGQKYDD